MTADELERLVIVDASVLITLAEIDATKLLKNMQGEIALPAAVAEEITEPPASDFVGDSDWISIGPPTIHASKTPPPIEESQERAEAHLGRSASDGALNGDVGILTSALFITEISERELVVLTDDKPLRKTCKALSIPISGSIGVLIRAVERGDIGVTQAKATLRAMDEVGARLSVSLLERAERLIEDAAE
jgi:predicted nucleic acid-binding protein